MEAHNDEQRWHKTEVKGEAIMKETQKKEQQTKILVVRVRGRIRLRTVVKDTLNMLHVYKVNYCTLIENTPTMRGMIEKVKDYTTWGNADEQTIEELFAKRGTLYRGPLTDAKKKITYKGRWIEHKGNKYNKYFKLNPPLHGYGREGIKKTFARGGALGDRKEKINDLVKRML